MHWLARRVLLRWVPRRRTHHVMCTRPSACLRLRQAGKHHQAVFDALFCSVVVTGDCQELSRGCDQGDVSDGNNSAVKARLCYVAQEQQAQPYHRCNKTSCGALSSTHLQSGVKGMKRKLSSWSERSGGTAHGILTVSRATRALQYKLACPCGVQVRDKGA